MQIAVNSARTAVRYSSASQRQELLRRCGEQTPTFVKVAQVAQGSTVCHTAAAATLRCPPLARSGGGGGGTARCERSGCHLARRGRAAGKSEFRTSRRWELRRAQCAHTQREAVSGFLRDKKKRLCPSVRPIHGNSGRNEGTRERGRRGPVRTEPTGFDFQTEHSGPVRPPHRVLHSWGKELSEDLGVKKTSQCRNSH